MSNLPTPIDQNGIIRALSGVGDVAKEGGRVAIYIVSGNKIDVQTKRGGFGSVIVGMLVIVFFVWGWIIIPAK